MEYGGTGVDSYSSSIDDLNWWYDTWHADDIDDDDDNDDDDNDCADVGRHRSYGLWMTSCRQNTDINKLFFPLCPIKANNWQMMVLI